MRGDVVLLPSGARHDLVSVPDGPTRAFEQVAKEQLMTPDGDLIIPGPGAQTCFLCAAYNYDHEVTQPLLSLLPPVLHVAASDDEGNSPVHSTLRLLSAELGRRGVGTRTVVDRLIDVLFVHVVREWLDRGESHTTASWIRGLRDPAIARVLEVLHGRPAERWTLESIAREVHLSRSTLARRFSDRVGEPPLVYLTRWRMDIAARLLRESDEPVGEVGRRVGYDSEFAFSRAFSRVRGVSPGRYRRSLRAGAQRPS
jgi:AraC-like DNA-binding protein